MASITASIMEIMGMKRLNDQKAINKHGMNSKKKRRVRVRFRTYWATLLLVISFFIAGCSFMEINSDAGKKEISIVASESETTEAEETANPTKVVTEHGVVEIVGLTPADGEDYLEPEDLPVDEDGYNGESMQAELDEMKQSSDETISESEEIISTSEENETKTTEQAESQEPEATTEETQKSVTQQNSSDPMTRVIDFTMLQTKKNADIYAWISVPGTNVDYPVLRHPTDNGYYLLHNLNGSQGYPGCIYTENYNSKDFTDPVTVLYGHDMRSTGTMFHQLHKFEKQSFFDKNQYFYIYTPEKTLKYEIFSAYVNSNEHLLGNHNFSNKEEFDSFFGTVLNTNTTVSHVRSGVAIDSNSKIVALSTCIKNQPNNRYLIFGVLVE